MLNNYPGPLFYKGWYHFFYQYNPNAAVWGGIVWGHAVSKDLIHWLHLLFAMVPDRWYDTNGVWTGSATLLDDGSIVMLYTGSTDKFVQVQNLAYPEDPNDPLLLKWTKFSGNPVLEPPPGIDAKDFRDPTTAWKTSAVDFKTYEKHDILLHQVPNTGMWECVDFYPVSKTKHHGLDTSVNGPEVKHVVKASMDDTRIDHYAIGTYHDSNGTWVPDNPSIDVGISTGLRYDYANRPFSQPKQLALEGGGRTQRQICCLAKSLLKTNRSLAVTREESLSRGYSGRIALSRILDTVRSLAITRHGSLSRSYSARFALSRLLMTNRSLAVTRHDCSLTLTRSRPVSSSYLVALS
ncbi:hypothetical protein Rs2_16025 [Raphanus sativus]|nr:hypothetical protein Rs2_16025 [Raphanus sativus]